jgi:hypothetical protein
LITLAGCNSAAPRLFKLEVTAVLSGAQPVSARAAAIEQGVVSGVSTGAKDDVNVGKSRRTASAIPKSLLTRSLPKWMSRNPC